MTHPRARSVIGGAFALTLASWLAGPVSAGNKQDVINSSHNLSASGPGAVKSS